MREFVILCDGEEFPEENVLALENAMQGFVKTDIPLCVEFIFVDGEEIRRLNREMRDTDKVTDVLSFPALDGIKGEEIKGADYPYEIDEDGNLMLGSIVVCCDRAKEQAEELGNSFLREVAFLTVHSTLHLLGYDHERSPEEDELQCSIQKNIIEMMEF